MERSPRLVVVGVKLSIEVCECLFRTHRFTIGRGFLGGLSQSVLHSPRGVAVCPACSWCWLSPNHKGHQAVAVESPAADMYLCFFRLAACVGSRQ
jgi:hypothetical protein